MVKEPAMLITTSHFQRHKDKSLTHSYLCSTIGGYIYIPGTSGATELVALLNKNANAQPEVSAYSQFWVYNGNCIYSSDN